MDKQISPRLAASRELQIKKIMGQLHACTDYDLRLVSDFIGECITHAEDDYTEDPYAKRKSSVKTSAIFFN